LWEDAGYSPQQIERFRDLFRLEAEARASGVLPSGDPDEVIVVMVEPDEVEHQGEGFLVTVPLSIQAVVKAGVSAWDFSRAYRSAETVIAAIKRAMEVEDRTLGGVVAWNGLERGSTAPLEREPGSEFVGVSVQYRAPIEEGWGAP
jgi:hypothetical protein